MLDLLASAPHPLRTAEIPYTLRTRSAGESKLDAKVGQEFIILLLEKMFGHFLPVRFLVFAAVGCIGLLVHLFVLGLTLNMGGESFRYAQALAIFVAMTFNFIVNNALTYRYRSEEHTSELQSLMRISYAFFCLKQKNIIQLT